jgi:sugar/nucleoside kinase (ribokinase family)
MTVLNAGSVAIDDVKTQNATRTGLMGGSGAYAAMASSFFAPSRVVGIVGKDFPPEHIETLKTRGVCTDGIEHSDGDSFYWSGEYHENMDERTTHSVAVNVLEAYQPKLPEDYKNSEIIVLANMSPQNQLDVLGQCNAPQFVVADTMDIWIQAERAALGDLLQKIDMLVINESEAKLFMETRNLVGAGRKLLSAGPKFAIIKTGEHGAMLFGPDGAFFRVGAYPLESVEDPTGAGDCFLGGLAGYLASTGDAVSFDSLKHSLARGTVMASFTCEAFSVERLAEISNADVDSRLGAYLGYTQL